MRKHSLSSAFLLTALSVSSSQFCFAQQLRQMPLARTFTAGAEERYQFTAIIRIETHGLSTEKIGEKTYAIPYTHEASGQISWRAIRKIAELKNVGSAAVTESLDQFHANCEGVPSSQNFNQDLQKSVRETCANWQDLSQMNYEEEKFGLIHGLPSAAGDITGPDSPLISLWLRRAFRPSVILPKTPLHFGDRAAHKVSGQSGIASNPEGEESMEWLEGSADPPAAVLHVVQNLSWIDPPQKKNASTATPNRRQLFYADSLNTISLLDGSLLKASRSASRETKEILDSVPGLPDAPTFSSKLTITVSILRLP